MSYFNFGFTKAFVGTFGNQADNPGVVNGVGNGMLTVAGVQTVALKNQALPNGLGLGVYGFFNKDSYVSVVAASAEVTSGQPLILASCAVPQNDKIGPFHGGYQESNKSKYINPKYISKFYKFEDNAPEQAIVHVGVTNFQTGTSLTFAGPCGSGYADGTYTNVATTTTGVGVGLTVDVEVVGGEIISMVENLVGTGYLVADGITPDPVTLGFVAGVECTTTTIATVGAQDCEFEFLCGETYNLHINLYGAPVLRVMNRDSYRNLAAYTGCCPEGTITPEAVDSTLVMINWASQIVTTPYLKDFIQPIVFDQAGDPWFATADLAIAALWPATQIWDNYVSPGYVAGTLAGLRLIGAYVDTVFDNCTFQTSDYWNKEVVQMTVQLVDEAGDPCTFNGICVETECCGFGGEGFGDTYVKELIMSESYLQNCFSSDPRIREITEGNALRDALSRTAFYTKYVIQHTVPRPYNPSSIYDADQYNLVIYLPSGATATELEAFMTAWLAGAGNPIALETFSHTACIPAAIPTP